MAKDVIGAAMVVGGGIGGMQAALDLADSGFYVYLVEKDSAIGGRMAQLDKTFPTNDCSMCIMSPKLVECGKHLNIEILTISEIEAITGEAGNFQVSIHQKARYIDPDTCTGCGDCAQVCPVTLPDEFNQGLGTRAATYLSYPQSVPRVYAIDKKDRPPCNSACPAHINVQGYLAMIKAGKYKEAIQIIMKDMPLPGVLGRVCVRFCEDTCRRREVDEALSIKELKRFAADQVDILSLPVPEITFREERVAIVGSGPSGLAAAYFLALDGYRPTVFEALDVAGGMLAVGIPEFRLPREVVETEINNIMRYGVEIQTSSPIGKDKTIDDLLTTDGYRAVYIATGAHKGMKLNISGEDDYATFSQCAPWLREVNQGAIKEIKGTVVILGGGNAAIDAARVSRRLGAYEVHIVYRRTQNEMPADPFEVEEALAEGIQLHVLITPKEVVGEHGTLTGITCLKNRLGEPDSSGRRRPVPIEGSEFFIPADHIIAAIGQTLDKSFATDTKDIEFSDYDLLTVNPDTLETKKKGVFAGGDVVTGPKTVIEAIAQGKQAAAAIAAYIQGTEIPSFTEPDRKEKTYTPIDPHEPQKARAPVPTLPVTERIHTFQEANLSMDEATAQREADRCLDCGVCCECFQCVEACKAQAVIHDMADRLLDINVGSIVLATGFQPYDPSIDDTYQYERFPNVVTSLEFERILSASGPYEGHLMRPSDKKEPNKIAWIQCVGSRNTHVGDKGYCSGVCCTYAIKQSLVAKEHSATSLDTAIFYIDIRTHGKDFEKFLNRAKNEEVRFVKSRIDTILPGQEEGNLGIRYTDEAGRIVYEEFDMVVLSVGLDIPQTSIELAHKLGIELNHYQFVKTGSFDPVHTTRPGIFVCGAFQGPKDIPETVMQASGAAAAASSLLSIDRFALTREREYPDEIDVVGKEPRIGVFVCHCGINIGGVVDVPGVTKYASTLPHVVVAEENLFTCSQDTQVRIRELIHEHSLNRVVVASCSTRTHEPLFQDTIREAGLNTYLFSMANIRDQDSWVHQTDKESATQKAEDLVRMAVANAKELTPLYRTKLPVIKRALVLGGGIAGMTAALNIAAQGFDVVLVELEKELGGMGRKIHTTLQGDDVRAHVDGLVELVDRDERIEVLKETILTDLSGTKGNYRTSLNVGPAMYHREVNHGALVIATGAAEYQPQEYLYGEHGAVKTQVEVEDLLLGGSEEIKEWNSVVMIQCVGSRNDANPNCSRVCCQQAIKNAIAIKGLNPHVSIFIIHRDIRTYGFAEDFYRKAREMGVHFLRYMEDEDPVVEDVQGRIQVTFQDRTLGRAVTMSPDQVILSTGVVAGDTEELASILKVPLTSEGFFLEAHVKLRPVDTQNDGIFICGMAHSSKRIDESISQALAASARACRLLSQAHIEAGGVVARVDPELCAACLICVRACPYEVPVINEDGVSEIDISKCQGCGVCAAECPAKAITLSHFEDVQILAQIDALMEAHQ